MRPQETRNQASAAAASVVTARDVSEILLERGWLAGGASAEQMAWCERAAALLGPQVSARRSLADLLQLIFHYDAYELLARVESHAALARYGARDVLRHLALLLLDGASLTPERFKEIITELKARVGIGSRDLFQPIRLVLAGAAGEGELDRVILLLDEAAAISFDVRAKTARERILEFCTAFE
jgi:glutamyl/glutaminyl-tRNA synthetase